MLETSLGRQALFAVGAEDAALVLRHAEALRSEPVDDELGDLDSALNYLLVRALDALGQIVHVLLNAGGELEVQVSEQRKELSLRARVGGHATSNEPAKTRMMLLWWSPTLKRRGPRCPAM